MASPSIKATQTTTNNTLTRRQCRCVVQAAVAGSVGAQGSMSRQQMETKKMQDKERQRQIYNQVQSAMLQTQHTLHLATYQGIAPWPCS